MAEYRRHLAVACIGTVAFLACGEAPSPSTQPPPGPAALRQLEARAWPVLFEPNRGQAAQDVAALARTAAYAVLLDGEGVRLAMPGEPRSPEIRRTRVLAGLPAVATPAAEVRLLTFPGAGLEWRLEEATATVSHHLRGPAAGSLMGLPTFLQARAEVGPGVALVVRGEGGHLRYDYEVAPGADPQALGWSLSTVTALALDDAGDLDFLLAGRRFRQTRPRVYQVDDAGQTVVTARYRLEAPDRVGLTLGPHDPRRPLTIDPTLVRVEPLTGQARISVAVDPSGAVYLGGAAFPGTGGTPAPDDTVGTVTRIDPDGTVAWTFDVPAAIEAVAADAGGVAFTGSTLSEDYPVVAAYQATLNGAGYDPSDAVVTRLDTTGTPVFSTYLGSSGLWLGAYNQDVGQAVALGPQGEVVVAGGTIPASDFPFTAGAVGRTGDHMTAFVARFTAAGALDWAVPQGGDLCWMYGRHTYDGATNALAVGVHGDGSVAWGGITSALRLDLANPIQSGHTDEAGCAPPDPSVLGGDAWAGRLTSATAWAWSTYYGVGPDRMDGVTDLVAGSDGSTRLVGWASAPADSFGVWLPCGASASGDGRIAVVDAAGALRSSVAWPGMGFNAVAGLPGGDLLVGGVTTAGGLDLPEAFQPALGGGSDGIVLVTSPDGATWRSGSYFGGSGDDAVWDVAAGGGVWVAVGVTNSADFPFTDTASDPGGTRPFVAWLSAEAPGGTDGGVDAGPADAGEDGGVDAGPADAGEDGGVDAGPADAGEDGGVDAGPADAGDDGGVDAGPVDAGDDGGVDGGPADAGADGAVSDAGVSPGIPDTGGCSCGPGAGAPADPAPWALLGLLAAWRRPRRRAP